MLFEDLSQSASSLWSPIPGGITTPSGFQASGIKAGLKSSDNLDLALLLAPEDSVCAGTFTKSLVRAACVDLCIDRLRANAGSVRAVLINSGQANACTGERGWIDSVRATDAVAQQLGLDSEKVLICSTGVIGEFIPLEKLIAGLEPLVDQLSTNGGLVAAKAILTTDLVEKQIAFEAYLGGRRVRIGGMAKGSGMIHPDLATMLGYISCDVGVPPDLWKDMITRVSECSFNSITVDGDTSTNDTFLAFSAGSWLENDYLNALEAGLNQAAQYLAKAIARDGEGANCLLEVRVMGTETNNDARQIARTVCSSSLVKTAVHGCDPNWGRIIAALGRSGISFLQKDVELFIGPYQLIRLGEPLKFDRNTVSIYMHERKKGAYLTDDSISILLKVGNGKGDAMTWGCDLSDQYVRINADYTT